MSQKLLAVCGFKFNPFSPELPTEALRLTSRVDSFCWRVEHSLVREGGFALISGYEKRSIMGSAPVQMLIFVGSGPQVLLIISGNLQIESSHAGSSGSRFQRGGFRGLADASTFSKSLALCVKIRTSIKICRIHTFMTQKVSDHGYVGSGGDQHHSCGVAEAMRADVLLRKRRHCLSRPLNIPVEFEPNADLTQRTAIAIDKDLLVLVAWFSFQQRLEESHGLRPQRTDTGFATFTEQLHLCGRIEANGRRRDIQSFLDPRSSVVEEREQCVVALPL
jgi:hypothetical protein